MKPIFLCFTENLDYALGWMVFHSLWQAVVVAFMVGIANIVLRKRSAQLRYVLSNLSLLLLFLMSIATFSYYYDFSKEANEVRFIPTGEANLTFQFISDIEQSTQTPLSIAAFKDYFNHNLPLIVAIWVLGVAIFLLKLLGGLSYVYYLKNRLNFPTDEYWQDMMHRLLDKTGLNKAVELVESAAVKTPLVIGHLKPMILFPVGVINRLSEQEVEAILAHEIAHIVRHDYVFNILQSIVESLFYYHPAVWWISNQIRIERESACDEMAIALINDKFNYAKALVTVQEMAYFPLSPALNFAGQRKNQFLIRMQRILNVPQNKSNIMEKLIATSIIIAALTGLTVAQNYKNKAENPAAITQTDTPQYPKPESTQTPNTEQLSNVTIIGDTLGEPFYTTLPPTPEIIKLQQELAQMEREYPSFLKEKETYIEKLKAELADMQKDIADFEKDKNNEIAQLEKQLSEKQGQLPKSAKTNEDKIAIITANIKKHEAELVDFTKKQEAENHKIEAQIIEKKKELEGKTQAKHSGIEGQIQALYGEMQANLGEIQAKRGEIQAMYGEILAIKGETMSGNGELQGIKGEIMGKRGEIMGHYGEIQGKQGEIQGVRGEIMGKYGEIQGKRGEIQGKYSELVFKTIVADLKSDNIITDDKKLYLRLNSKSMYVNDLKMSDEIHAKYKTKYIKGNMRGFEIYKKNGNLNFSIDEDDN